MCYLAGAIFTACGLLLFVTKATSILKPDLIAIVVIAALAIAAVTSFRAGGRYRRSITPAQHDRGSVTG